MNVISKGAHAVAAKPSNLLSVAEVLVRCSIGRTTCYKWMADGTLRSTRVHGRRLIDGASVQEVIDRCQGGLATEPR